jgi:hypothetical protein
MAKSTISLVSVQKPTTNTPVLQRRNIEQQIVKIGSFREGRRISREQFWVDNGVIYFQLRYGKQPIELEKGKPPIPKRSEAIVISGAGSAFCYLCFPPREV